MSVTDANETRDHRSDAAEDVRAARTPSYVPPELVEYGTVAKLTQSGGGFGHGLRQHDENGDVL